MYRAPNKCPVCAGKLTISQLTCETCGSRLEGQFDGCPFCGLSPEESRFLLTFIKNRGSIKDVERELGVSYPTVRAALDGLITSLGLLPEAGATDEKQQKSETDADTEAAGHADTATDRAFASDGHQKKARARRDILNLLAQHRITADEAADRLKKL